jgi:hypothetical protein
VNTVVQLSKQVPENLIAKMDEINNARKLVRRMPTLKEIKAWIAQVKNYHA